MATVTPEMSQDEASGSKTTTKTKSNPPKGDTSGEQTEPKAPETPKDKKTSVPAPKPATPVEESKTVETPPKAPSPGYHGNSNSTRGGKDQHGVYESMIHVSREPHKMQTGWTLHMDRKRKRGIKHEEFKSGLKLVSSFSTIEDFYNIWSFVKKPEALPSNVNIYLFRQGLVPAWESFPRGGHWIIKVTKGNGLVDLLWEELVMATLGEQFGTPELVGIALSIRSRNDVITLWNRDNYHTSIRFTLGERLKSILNLHHNTTVEYKEFSAALNDKSTTKGAKQYIYVAQN